MPTHKSNDYKLTAVQYYLVEDKTQQEVCKIFKCSPRSLMRWCNQNKLIILDNASSHVLRDIPLTTFKNIFNGVYGRPEKYKPKNKTRKIKKNYL
jgi:transposase-like protein